MIVGIGASQSARGIVPRDELARRCRRRRARRRAAPRRRRPRAASCRSRRAASSAAAPARGPRTDRPRARGRPTAAADPAASGVLGPSTRRAMLDEALDAAERRRRQPHAQPLDDARARSRAADAGSTACRRTRRVIWRAATACCGWPRQARDSSTVTPGRLASRSASDVRGAALRARRARTACACRAAAATPRPGRCTAPSSWRSSRDLGPRLVVAAR